MAVDLNHAAAIAARRAEVSKLYIQGSTQHEIAVQCGVSQQQISKDLIVIRAQWRTSTIRNFDEQKSLELSRIDQLESAAWEGYARTIGMHRVTRKETGAVIPDGEGTIKLPGKITETSEKLAGDTRFLDIVHKCVSKRCDILGLDAPKRSTLSNPDGTPLVDAVRIVFVKQGETQ